MFDHALPLYGLYAAQSTLFLVTISLLILCLFGIPMAFYPLHWARVLRWRIPEHTDLAVYFGRCLGFIAITVAAMGLRAANDPTALALQGFWYDFLQLIFIIMIFIHIYGAIRRIQPITETLEIIWWAGLALATHIFHPFGSLI
jgi:hypothetical protein